MGKMYVIPTLVDGKTDSRLDHLVQYDYDILNSNMIDRPRRYVPACLVGVLLTICSYKRKFMKPNVKSLDKRKRSKSLKLLWLVDLGIRMLECWSCSRNYRGSN
jgi:hypothetical protein